VVDTVDSALTALNYRPGREDCTILISGAVKGQGARPIYDTHFAPPSGAELPVICLASESAVGAICLQSKSNG